MLYDMKLPPIARKKLRKSLLRVEREVIREIRTNIEQQRKRKAKVMASKKS